jgi:hypothetical protein
VLTELFFENLAGAGALVCLGVVGESFVDLVGSCEDLAPFAGLDGVVGGTHASMSFSVLTFFSFLIGILRCTNIHSGLVGTCVAGGVVGVWVEALGEVGGGTPLGVVAYDAGVDGADVVVAVEGVGFEGVGAGVAATAALRANLC